MEVQFKDYLVKCTSKVFGLIDVALFVLLDSFSEHQKNSSLGDFVSVFYSTIQLKVRRSSAPELLSRPGRSACVGVKISLLIFPSLTCCH